MKKNPDISIIVPVYNGESYIKKCIDSLVNQTKKEIEIIIVNDGSSDNTEKKIKEYDDERIKYFKNKNKGIGYSRNFGIVKSTGKYLMFIDSDDYIEENTCEELYEKAKNEDLDLVVCDFYREFSNKKLKEEIIEDFSNTKLIDNPKLLRTVNLSPWNKLYRRDLIIKNDIRFIEDLKYEDAPFVIECLYKAKLIGKLNKCLNHYVIRDNSETTIRDEKCFDILKIIDIFRKLLKDERKLKNELDKLTVRIITNYTIQQRKQKDKKVAKKFIDEAFNYLETNIPDYKDNKYYENRGVLRRTIEKSKLLTTIYCSL